jgi:hypothetical protein
MSSHMAYFSNSCVIECLCYLTHMAIARKRNKFSRTKYYATGFRKVRANYRRFYACAIRCLGNIQAYLYLIGFFEVFFFS